jgi:IS30 family transposase
VLSCYPARSDGLGRPSGPRQGSELACHEQIALLRDVGFFAHPASPWRRGINREHGVEREFFPNGNDLSVLNADQLLAVEEQI